MLFFQCISGRDSKEKYFPSSEDEFPAVQAAAGHFTKLGIPAQKRFVIL
jgi:hypothetical protein